MTQESNKPVEMLAVTPERMAELYDDALFAEDKATGAMVPGYARRSALRAMQALAEEVRLSSTPTAADRNAVLEEAAKYHDDCAAEATRLWEDAKKEGLEFAHSGLRVAAEHRKHAAVIRALASASPTAAAADMRGLADDVSTLDVFLAAYADYSDGEVIASIVDPADDLLALGALRRILSRMGEQVPSPTAIVDGPRGPELGEELQ
jgi:hypothetical protein